MSDNKDNNKKGFFSRLFGGSNASVQTKTEVTSSEQSSEIPSMSALNKMKKADIVSVAKDNGLELDINLTKAKLLEAWELHFSSETSPSAVDDAADVMAEVAAAKEAPVEEAAEEKEAEIKISLDEKTSAQIISDFENKQLKTDLPEFRPGDTIVVSVKVGKVKEQDFKHLKGL